MQDATEDTNLKQNLPQGAYTLEMIDRGIITVLYDGKW